MIAGERSRTIDRPALMRAAHQLLDAEPKIFRDPFAVGLTDGTSGPEIERRADELRTPACKLLRSAMVLRSRHAEDQLAAALDNGVEQYVILGAGLDTFPLRQPPNAAKLRIFEVDQPLTQRWKLERLRSLGIRVPANVAHVAVDLETKALQAALRESGFDRRKRAFFSWLGVTQYLHDDAIDATLRHIASLPPGSGVTFSFTPPEEALSGLDRGEARTSAERAEAIGEPWRSRPTVEMLAAHLRRLRFTRIEHLNPVHAQRIYFQDRRDGLQAARFEQLVSAFV